MFEPWAAPVRMDEIQGQILAGNVIRSGSKVVPSGPGYLAWLAGRGFPTDPSRYPIVDIVDDGIDRGDPGSIAHPDFHEAGSAAAPDRIVYLANCTTDPLPDGLAGHGNLNAGIVGGYNNSAGLPFQDAAGYRLGLGISPYNRLAGTKIFANEGDYEMLPAATPTKGW